MSHPESPKDQGFLPDIDPELHRLAGQVAGRLTDESFTAVVEGTDTLEVAESLVYSSGLLTTLGYPGRAEQQLNLFDSMGLTESPENATLFTAYRLGRIRLLEHVGVTSDNLEIQAYINEQMASPAQNDRSSLRMHEWLIEQSGDANSFSIWLTTKLEDMYTSPIIADPKHNPFPPFEAGADLHRLIQRQVRLLQQAYESKAGDYKPQQRTLLSWLDVIETAFADSPRKALFNEEISGSVWYLAQCRAAKKLAKRATKFYFAMQKTAVEDPVDRISDRITDSRLHKRALMHIVGKSADEDYPKLVEKASAMLANWEAQGILDEADLRKITIWKEDTVRRLAKERKRQAREDEFYY